MKTEARQEIVRLAGWTLVAHTTFVLTMVVSKNALWEMISLSSPRATQSWWVIRKIFRLIELPVTWAVDPLLQVFPLIPPWAAFGRVWIATSVSEFILYGSLGGAFYALVAGIIGFLREQRRAKRGG